MMKKKSTVIIEDAVYFICGKKMSKDQNNLIFRPKYRKTSSGGKITTCKVFYFCLTGYKVSLPLHSHYAASNCCFFLQF
eukprot:UN27337